MIKQLEAVQALSETLTNDAIEYEQWDHWCTQVEQALAGNVSPTLRVQNLQRKWELVSSYQKTVRRGDTALAQHLVCGMVSMETEWTYMWRRICTTAAEDIGAGNPLLMKFVIACAMNWTPGKMTPPVALNLWTCLTRLMCQSSKSRIYCALSILQGCLKDTAEQGPFNSQYGQSVQKVLQIPYKTWSDPEALWLEKNNYRGEGMLVGPLWLRFLKVAPLTLDLKFQGAQKLLGLPDYAYDMHTRVGKGTCIRLCGHQLVKTLFAQFKPKDKSHALGWAMFFEEGGRIQDEVFDKQLSELEQFAVAEKHGLLLSEWQAVRQTMRQMLDQGVVNDMRAKLLADQGY